MCIRDRYEYQQYKYGGRWQQQRKQLWHASREWNGHECNGWHRQYRRNIRHRHGWCVLHGLRSHNGPENRR